MGDSNSQVAVAAGPRHLFFGVEDYKVSRTPELQDSYLVIERARRAQAKDRAIVRAQHLISAIKAVYSFDQTGNVMATLPHLEEALSDVVKLTNNLMNDVGDAGRRYAAAIDDLAAKEASAAAAVARLAGHLK